MSPLLPLTFSIGFALGVILREIVESLTELSKSWARNKKKVSS